MKHALKICVLAVPLAVLGASPAFADVKTHDKTQIKFEGMLGRMMGMFGGKAARDGIESTTVVQGGRMVTTTDSTAHIVDLSEEKVYDLDLKKKTYTVTTFDELRQRMREAAERAKKNAEKAEPSEKKEPAEAQIEVDFDVKQTGQTKQVAGYDTHQSIATITVRQKGRTLDEGGGLVMTVDSWLGPAMPQMKELADFNMRFWRQLNGPQTAAMSAEQTAAVMAMYPMLKDAMGRWQKEAGAMKGTPLATSMTFEGVKSTEEMSQEKESGGGGGLTGMFARKIMKKDQPKQRATIFTSTHEMLEVSTSVAAGDLAIPAGFKEKK